MSYIPSNCLKKEKEKEKTYIGDLVRSWLRSASEIRLWRRLPQHQCCLLWMNTYNYPIAQLHIVQLQHVLHAILTLKVQFGHGRILL